MRNVEIDECLNAANRSKQQCVDSLLLKGALLREILISKLASNESHPPSPGTLTPDSAIGHDDDVFSLSTKETGTLTDVSSTANLPEVEILSLIEEQIPKYRLRTDTITDFQGCSNSDWIQTPLVPLDDDIDLTNDQLQGYFSYLLLCGERVSQMTKTYNDIEAVSRLLEEKERDLELAATIGQALLEKNRDIEEKNESLDEDLRATSEKVNQLKHELALKDELLRVYTEESEENDDSPSLTTQVFSSNNANIDALQKKVHYLEEDNLSLRSQFEKLHDETDTLEEKEQKLFGDYVQELTDVVKHKEFLSDELAKKTEEAYLQREEILKQQKQIVDLQNKVKVLTIEKVELQKHLEASQSSQKKLTKELSLLKDRYDELFEMLEEAQDELRVLRKKQRPGASKQYLSSSLLSIPSDSLASELENSLRADAEYPTGYSPRERKMHNWKIFETAKAAKRAARSVDVRLRSRHAAPSSISSFLSGAESGSESVSQSLRSSFYLSDAESNVSDGYSGDLESISGSVKNLGRPGIPGSNDLETAVRRLAIRNANELNEQDYKEMEEKRQEKSQSMEPQASPSPAHSETCESTLSTGSGGQSSYSYNINLIGGSNNPYFRIPEKLQIVKPLEGSVTLRQWQQLATPHLGGIFEERPGVQIKGERKLEMQEELYSLSDYEEDDEYPNSPGRNFMESPSVYTFTDSKVRHPSHSPRSVSSSIDIKTETTNSALKTQSSTVSRNRGTPTYSMSLGLASILDERDLLLSPTSSETVQPPLPGKNPARFPSLVSDTKFSASKTKVTESYTLSLTTTCVTTVTSSGRQPKISPSEHLLGVLKNTGSTFYEYFTGFEWNKSAQTLPSSVSSSSLCTMTSCSTVTMTSSVTSSASQSLYNSPQR